MVGDIISERVGDFKSEWWARSSRNPGRHRPESAKYSPGQQLKALFAAFKQLKGKTDASAGHAMNCLEEMIKGAEEVKQRHSIDLRHDAERALQRLKAADLAQYQAFINDHEMAPRDGTRRSSHTGG
ncbi:MULTISPECIES: hypothetical protein [Bradyrhizobium]|jgi:hypothetical protein|uniref:Uncharacterized protein n=1 Tax=Bradyrhizobium elkanii TaxID=29448 RepID=A0A8I1Y351_BRAEL|nr:MULTISPECIES: hypothetical protein [Bradyrhizobium]MBP1293644.1 hypothetical protein [Bradyrhizobium elkanii]MCP1925772.1 hypothetical protein [Bradyrhizobium elkanii]MCS3451406.1 hypothetical protein [Bradyrhizobium elkanii]MCS3476736.1 hypothetical protein [Bradyrhizobium elkanii]MCS3566569.1 hypothetical protein [Bradyrhizobium elkanii]